MKTMYNKLRLSCGGGIKSTVQKVEQAKNTATVVIGIGGTGIDALRMVKKTVYENVKQDNWCNSDVETPCYSRIKFLAIDSDQTCITNSSPELDLSREFKNIGNPRLLHELENKEKIVNTSYLKWMNLDIDTRWSYNGAGGKRQVGKYLLAQKAEELYHDFKAMILSAITGLDIGFNLNIYIMAGLGGGTGSGCFIDTCYIIQQVLVELGYDSKASVFGFFFLPDVNLSRPNFPLGGPCETAVRVNGYAALKELDYLMNIPNNGDVYEQQYNETFGVKLAKPPVTFCNLFSVQTEGGAHIENGYDYVINSATECILNFVVDSEDVEKGGGTVHKLIGGIDVLTAGTYRSHGANYVYNILGTACAVVPYKEISTYLAIGFFDSIKYIQTYQPNRDAVETLCRNIGLNTQHLTMDVKAGTVNLIIDPSAFETKVLKAANVGEIAMSLSRFCENWRTRYMNRVISNVETLTRGLVDYEVSDKPESVVGKVFKELMSLTRNPQYGPYYAAAMLKHAQNHTLFSELAGIIREITERRDHAAGQSDYRWIALEKAQTRFNATPFDPLNTKKNDYVKQVEVWYQNRVEIDTYNAFLDMLYKIQEHLYVLEKEYFEKYVRVVNKLIETFEDNRAYFDTFGMGVKRPSWSVVDINSIKSELDAAVAQYIERNNVSELVAPRLVDEFNMMMINKRNLWFDENETQIAEMISSFIHNKFASVMSKNMLAYLQEKYQCGEHDLVEPVSDDVIKGGLVDRAIPMFDINSMTMDLCNPASHAEYIVLSIPNNEERFRKAAMLCKDIWWLQMIILQSALRDRISMLKFYGGIPLFAYRGLPDLEATYYSDKYPGIHLYEGQYKDWNNLPSPIPATCCLFGYTRMNQEEIDGIVQLYQGAVDKKVIEEDMINQRFIINQYGEVDYDSIFVEGWNQDILSVKTTKKKLLEEKEKMQNNIEEQICIRCSNFEKSHIDNFVRMPIYIEKVRCEMQKIEKLEKKIAEL